MAQAVGTGVAVARHQEVHVEERSSPPGASWQRPSSLGYADLLFELVILALRFLHCFRLQLLGVSIQTDEDAPTREQYSHCEHQCGRIQQFRRSFVRRPKRGNEGFDGQCHDEHDKKSG